jgi:hypothetical protein
LKELPSNSNEVSMTDEDKTSPRNQRKKIANNGDTKTRYVRLEERLIEEMEANEPAK